MIPAPPPPHYPGQDGPAGAFQQFLPRVPPLPLFQPGFLLLSPTGKDPGQEADWSQPGEGTQNTTKGRCCEQAVPEDPRWEQGLESEELFSEQRTPQSLSIPLEPRSAIRPRPPAPARRDFYNLWFSNHPSPPPFLRTHSFAPRIQRPCLNLKGKQPPALQTAAREDGGRLGSSLSPAQIRAGEFLHGRPSPAGKAGGAPASLPGKHAQGYCVE